MRKLQKLIDNISNSDEYHRLENFLNQKIKNEIVDEDYKILLILSAVCESYKDDQKMREMTNNYCWEFENKKLSTDNLDERILYFKSSKFCSYIPEFKTKLVDVYSKYAFDFILEKYDTPRPIIKKSNNE